MLKNLILYLISLLIFALFSVMYNSYDTGILFLIWCMVPVVLFACLVYTYKSLRVSMDVSANRVEKGDGFDLIIDVHNTSIIPISRLDIYLEYSNQYSQVRKVEKMKLSLDMRNKQQIRTMITSSYLGVITLCIQRVKVFDFLHVFSISKRLKQKQTVVILPNYSPLNLLPLDKQIGVISDEGEVVDRIGNDPSEVFGIREYMDGDRGSRIHYKLSNKYDSLMVKEYSEINSIHRMMVFAPILDGKSLDYIGYVDALYHVLYSQMLEEIGENTVTLFYGYNNILYGREKVNARDGWVLFIEQLILESYMLSPSKEIEKEEKYGEHGGILEAQLNYDSYETYSHITYICTRFNMDEFLTWSNHHRDAQIHIIYVNDLSKVPLVNKELLDELEGNRGYVTVTEIDIKRFKDTNKLV